MKRSMLAAVCGVAVCAILASVPCQAGVTIIGGPTFDSASGNGYKNPALAYGYTNVCNGAVTGYAEKFVGGVSKGNRGIRWDVFGNVTELGTLGTNSSGVTDCKANTLNSVGAVVGMSTKYVGDVSKNSRAVRWDASGTTATELGGLGTNSSGATNGVATGINTAGTTVGYAIKYDGGAARGYRPVRWDAGSTTAVELEIMGTYTNGGSTGYAYTINDAGTITGCVNKYVSGVSQGMRPVRWSASGAVTELGVLGTDSYGSGYGQGLVINAAGDVAGYVQKYVGGNFKGNRAVRWDATGTVATELAIMGTDANGVSESGAASLNDAGTAVGYARKYVNGVNMGDRPVRWAAGGSAVTELGILGTNINGVTAGCAYATNAVGVTIGLVAKYDAGGTLLGNRAMMWRASGEAIDLTTMLSPGSGWVSLNSACGITNDGWISGIGSFDPDGAGPLAAYDRMFLMAARAPGDANLDGRCDFSDYLVLESNFGGTGKAWNHGDFDSDGDVDFKDYLALESNFGTVASVPEPISMSVLLAGAMAILRPRRRSLGRR